jgi:hypothetical protein
VVGPSPLEGVIRGGGVGRYQDKKTLRAALNRTLLHDQPLMRHKTGPIDISWVNWAQPNDHLKHPGSRVEGWISVDRFRQTNAHFPIFSSLLRELFTEESETGLKLILSLNEPANRYDDGSGDLLRFAIGIEGRKLITTRTGWLGLAPEESEIGDIIAILFGCNYPVVLRPSSNDFKYIGECYVDGLMDGEAVEAATRGEYNEIEITIV